MASFNLMALFALLLVLQLANATNTTNTTTPSVNSYLDKLCDGVECGNGTCKASLNYTFNFICECESGWRRTKNETDNDEYPFLPCVIPNCTLDYSCTEAPAPAPTPAIQEKPKNISFFDPCYWVYCGGGSCSEKADNGYTCDCNDGYSNLMNNTAYPCFSQCVLGRDCKDKGVTLSNETASASAPNGSTDSNDSSNIQKNFLWLIVLIISVALVPWN